LVALQEIRRASAYFVTKQPFGSGLYIMLYGIDILAATVTRESIEHTT